jgi:Chalcone isomerase-like
MLVVSALPSLDRRRALKTLLRAGLGVSGAGSVLAAAQAQAQVGKVVYEGESFDRRIVVAGSELQLNGLGVRQVAWFKGYVAALYLAAPASTAEQALGARGAKRIQLRLLHDVPAAELAKAVRKGILRNTSAQQQGALSERLERLVKLIEAVGTVRKKDVVNLDLDPARGLLVYVNAVMRGEAISGEDFYAALLRSFVGESPYDAKMRDGLLGKLA